MLVTVSELRSSLSLPAFSLDSKKITRMTERMTERSLLCFSPSPNLLFSLSFPFRLRNSELSASHDVELYRYRIAMDFSLDIWVDVDGRMDGRNVCTTPTDQSLKFLYISHSMVYSMVYKSNDDHDGSALPLAPDSVIIMWGSIIPPASQKTSA